jgi:mannosyl-3-phosphoglycerate phosphatase
MSVDEVARRTGLSLKDAALARQRDYDEPFVVEGRELADHALAKAAADHGLCWTKGDRFHHLMGRQDKGEAVRHLIRLFQRNAQDDHTTLTTVAIGNSLNDVPMLAVVDTPILVQQADGSYAAGIDLPRLIHAPAPGPAGWNGAVLALLKTIGRSLGPHLRRSSSG